MLDQPAFGLKLREIRESDRSPAGKKMSRNAFADHIGEPFTATSIANIEKGRKLKQGEIAPLLAAFPELDADPAEQLEKFAWSDDLDRQIETTPTPMIDLDEEFGDNDPEDLLVDLEPLPDWLDIPPDPTVPTADVDAAQDAAPQSTASAATGSAQISTEPPDTENHWSNVPGAAPPAQTDPNAAAVEAASAFSELDAPGSSQALQRILGVHYVSNSEIQTFKRCRRKWWLGWYRGFRRSVHNFSDARSIGDRVHRALKGMYPPDGQTPVDPRDALERAITEDWTLLTRQAKAEGWEEVPESTTKAFNDATALERIMVEGYVEWIAETAADRGLKVIAPETYIDTPMDVEGVGIPVHLIGKIDARLYRESDGVLLFMDHKTVQEFTSPTRVLHLDEQMKHYHLLEWLKQIESDGWARCDGAIYNMLRKVKRTARANPPFYQRVEVRHNEYELSNFRARIGGIVRTMLDVKEQLDALDPEAEDIKTTKSHHSLVYPSPTKDCAWDCDFFSVCGMLDDGSRAEDMLRSEYTVGDPLDRYTKKEE